MTEWQGKIKVTTKTGRPVVIDEWAYPKSLTFTFEGEGDSPDLVAKFEMRPPSGPVCTSIQVTTKPGGRGVTDQDLRMFDLESLGTRAFATAALYPMPDSGHAYAGKWEHVDEAAEVLRESRVDHRLMDVAQVYLGGYASGAPLAAVEDRLGSRSTAARWVKRAREAGLIPEQGAPAEEYELARRRLAGGNEGTSQLSQEEIRQALRDAGHDAPFPEG